MPVLLNGGAQGLEYDFWNGVPLADACATEWRAKALGLDPDASEVPLADACATEWRGAGAWHEVSRTCATR